MADEGGGQHLALGEGLPAVREDGPQFMMRSL